MRFISSITLAALLGVSIADETYIQEQNKIANNLCYIQDGLNIFDLRTLANPNDYQVVVTNDVYAAGSNLVFNLCQYTKTECNG
jgi:uncharacterized protein YaiI (UPF0178 family)